MTCGIDWAGDHHDVAVVDEEGRKLAKLRISDDPAGLAALLELLAAHGDTPQAPIPIAIETSRGLLVAMLRTSGRPICAINPMAVARYREYYPGFLAAFDGAEKFTSCVARTILAAAPTPAAASVLTRARLRTLLRKAGRTRGIDSEAKRLHTAFAVDQMRQPPLVEQAMGAKTLALLRQLDAACQSADELEQAACASFSQHPDAEIITSFPGLGPLLGARVLAEIGDDRSRFADARALKAYAGTAPITRASGKKTSVRVRRVKNDRLATVGYRWAFCALLPSPGARAHYDRRRTTGDWHAAALRNLTNKLLGCLFHCLQTRTGYDETIAFPTPDETDLQQAA